jgi:hypothetical protein
MPLSALEFAQIENSRFPFGVSPKSVADTLRKIGDMVESGELCVHSARVVGLAVPNDYSKTSIRLVFTEKTEKVPCLEENIDGGDATEGNQIAVMSESTGNPVE